MKETLMQVIKYGLVGVLGLIIDFGSYYLLVTVFNIHYSFSDSIRDFFQSIGVNTKAGTSDALVSSIIGNTLGAINNFVLNSYFTFKVSDKKLQRFVPYIGVVIIGMILSTFFMTIMLDYIHLDKDLSKIVAIVLVAGIQFIINKLVVFRKKKAVESQH